MDKLLTVIHNYKFELRIISIISIISLLISFIVLYTSKNELLKSEITKKDYNTAKQNVANSAISGYVFLGISILSVILQLI
jgi:hypothetical protein